MKSHLQTHGKITMLQEDLIKFGQLMIGQRTFTTVRQCWYGTCLGHVWDIWDIVWDSLGHSVGQSQNSWDIKKYQH